MDLGDHDDLIPPVPPEAFALIVRVSASRTIGDATEASLRRMGFQPVAVEGREGDGTCIASPRFRLRFGGASMLAGPAADVALDAADPDDPATSLLAASLPAGWREAGTCWLFLAERDEEDGAGSGGQPERMREFFKMMVLLIDLFDASHIFWSPARLWSDATQFRASVAEMLESGMPPVLHLIAFRRWEAGGTASVRTRGLAFFAGQELEARIPGGWTVADMVRRLSRLALDMMLNGPVRYPRTMRGLEAGEWIGLLPPTVGTGPQTTVVVEFGRDA
ncbi:hypothetical protein [Sphingopyxis kveilinensis]|uniref:hypothetical protein n=1 Tax=Sphingopyxis kveilinensis TaxID=3114367 RepID=UPI0030D3B905